MKKIEKVPLTKKQYVIVVVQTLIIAVGILLALLWNDENQMAIASTTDATIMMTADQNMITQSWQANSKNIQGFILPIDLQESQNLAGKLQFSLKEELEGEEVICEQTIDLSSVNDAEVRFSFEQQKLELGKRYYFQLKLEGKSDTGLAVQINSAYGGLLLMDQETDGAIGGIVLYESANNLAWIVRIFLVLMGITCLLMVLFNRKFEEVFAASFGIAFVYIYLWGIFEKLEGGIISLWIISMLCMLIVPYFMKIKQRTLKSMISPGMIAFWVLFLLYFMLDRNVVAGKADDLSHWQLCVRDMWYFDSYAFHPGSTLFVMRYTPGFATIEYLFLYLYGSYREGIILLGCHTIGFVFLSILYTKVEWKSCHKVIPLTALIAGLPLLLYQSHYGILYVDAYLGIIGAYLLICYFTEEHSWFNVFRITLGSIVLIMTKEMGLVIAATIYLIIFIDVFRESKKIKLFIKNKKLKSYFLSGIISVATFASWWIYMVIVGGKYGLTASLSEVLEKFGLAKVTETAMPVQEEILLVSAAETAASAEAIAQTVENVNVVVDASPVETISEMIKWFFVEKDFPSGTYIEEILFVTLLCGILGMTGLYQKLKIPMKQILSSIALGTIIYAAFLTVCYIFVFPNEASAIPAAKRYMGSYLLLTIIAVVGIIIVRLNEYKSLQIKQNWLVWMISIFVLMCVPDNHPYYTTEENFGGYFTTWKNHQSIGEVFRSFADKDEKIYYVEYSDSDLIPQYNCETFVNAVVPNLTQGLNGKWKPIVSDDAPFNNYTKKYTAEEWAQLLAEEYTYVYLRYIDDYFISHYSSLFENQEDIVSGGIFKVNVQGEDVFLQKIAFKDLN